MEFDEELINKIKNEIEFNKTKSELLIELINKMGKVGDDLKQHLSEMMRNSYSIKNEIKDFFKIREIHDTSKSIKKNKEVVAIDGSSNVGGQLSGKFVSLYSVARIYLRLNRDGHVIPSEQYWGDMEIIDALDEKEIQKKLEIKMIKKETEAYEKSLELMKSDKNEENLIFIDGPIIDPPFYKDKDYVKFRAQIIKRVVEKNTTIIGCVKKVYGDDFCRFITKSIDQMDINKRIALFLNDSYMISSLIADYRKKNNFHGCLITDFYETIPTEGTPKFLYEKDGIRIKSLFFQYSTKHRLIRIDIPILNSIEYNFTHLYEKVKDNLTGWSYPGIDLPYPVYLAHEFSKIRNGCAKKIYDDIITKNLSNKPENQLFISMLK